MKAFLTRQRFQAGPACFHLPASAGPVEWQKLNAPATLAKTELMKTGIGKYTTFALAVAGLLLCGNARAAITVHDGSLMNIRQQTNGSSSISTNFTVTSGASVLVVSLYDQNNVSTDKSPSSLTWGSQTLTKIIGENNSRSTYADSDIFYLFNPNPGTQTITATDTSGSNVLAMAIQVYTLSGVNTSVSPVANATNAAYATNSLVTLSSSTPGRRVGGGERELWL